MSYINSVSASFAQQQSSTYSVNRKSDTKPGIIELNKIKIRVNEGDSLQRICNKINSKTSLHFVTAKLVRERGHTVISLSSSKQIDILDRNNILNNIGMLIRANLVRNSLVDGLILTFLAEHKKASPRYIVQPYQINNLPEVYALREEVNEAVDSANNSNLSIHSIYSSDIDIRMVSSNDHNSRRSSIDIQHINNREERKKHLEYNNLFIDNDHDAVSEKLSGDNTSPQRRLENFSEMDGDDQNEILKNDFPMRNSVFSTSSKYTDSMFAQIKNSTNPYPNNPVVQKYSGHQKLSMDNSITFKEKPDFILRKSAMNFIPKPLELLLKHINNSDVKKKKNSLFASAYPLAHKEHPISDFNESLQRQAFNKPENLILEHEPKNEISLSDYLTSEINWGLKQSFVSSEGSSIDYKYNHNELSKIEFKLGKINEFLDFLCKNEQSMYSFINNFEHLSNNESQLQKMLDLVTPKTWDDNIEKLNNLNNAVIQKNNTTHKNYSLIGKLELKQDSITNAAFRVYLHKGT